MNHKRIKIKYQGYDPTLDERLTALAVSLGAEFSDRPLGDGVREMSFNFENDRHGNAFTTRDVFQILSINRSHLRQLAGENPTNEHEAADVVLYKLERKVRAKLRAELRNPESSSIGDHGVALPPIQPRIRTRRTVQLRRKFATAMILVTIGVIGIRTTLTHLRNSEKEERESQRVENDRRLNLHRAISAMASSQSAIVNWQDDFCKDKLLSIYSQDLENVLVRQDHRPLLWFVRLDDVEGQTEPYTLRFQGNLCPGAEIHLKLASDDRRTEEILKHRHDRLDSYYAVVADILQVAKLPLVEGGSLSREAGAMPTDAFEASGSCEELLFLGVDGIVPYLAAGISTDRSW